MDSPDAYIRTMDRDKTLRDHLLYLLRGGGAHLSLEKAVADFPADLRGAMPKGLPHTPWRLLEHLRLAQWDIVEFCRNADHVSPAFPDGYWPEGDAPPDAEAWDRSVAAFQADLQAVQKLVTETEDLFAPAQQGHAHTILREALLVADHNAYHLGQLVMLRRLLGAWADD